MARDLRFSAFLAHLLGHVDVGSRTPVNNTPAWVTLEVAHGGFATGGFVAGGPLTSAEHQLISQYQMDADTTTRHELNKFFLTELGLHKLVQALHSGHYHVDVPEASALLVVAYLIDHDLVDAATSLVKTIEPWMGQLRFYPEFTDTTKSIDAMVVSIVTAGEAKDALEHVANKTTHPRVALLAQIINRWLPLYDALVGLFAETADTTAGDCIPCQRFSADRDARAAEVYADLVKSRHIVPKKKGNVVGAMERVLNARLHGGLQLSDHKRDIGWIRTVLVQTMAHARGLPSPNNAAHVQVRARQARQLVPKIQKQLSEFAKVVIRRLDTLNPRDGIDEFDTIAAPVNATEATTLNNPRLTGQPLPSSIRLAVSMAKKGSFASLAAEGLFPSAEAMAPVIATITAGSTISAADPVLQAVLRATYASFRRRRSLLLLNYAKQVQVNELPWVSAMEPFLQSRDQASDLSTVARAIATTFPATLLPNKVVRECALLYDTCPMWLEELASDIFMGGFSPKFHATATAAVAYVQGTIYGRYYHVPKAFTPAYTMVDAASAMRSAVFGQEKRSFVVDNGMLIEQVMVLTTHNSLPLVQNARVTNEDLVQMVGRCLDVIDKRFSAASSKSISYVARLSAMKSAAFAWRQCVFYLAELEKRGRAWPSWMYGPDDAWSASVKVLLDGLARAHRGEPVVPFYGWGAKPLTAEPLQVVLFNNDVVDQLHRL